MPVLALILAAAIGLSLGTLGGGGSVLTVPVLVYLVGYDPKVAVPTSLAVVGSASLMGALGHWRAGRVDLRVALSFGLVAIIGSYLGAKLGLRMRGELQLAILAVVMVTAAVLMLRPTKRGGSSGPGGMGAKSDRDHAVGVAWEDRAAALRHIVRLSPVAAGVGLLTGVVGVGGGFLIVPALVIWGGVPMATAVGTSLFVITLNCLAGLVGYVGQVAIPGRARCCSRRSLWRVQRSVQPSSARFRNSASATSSQSFFSVSAGSSCTGTEPCWPAHTRWCATGHWLSALATPHPRCISRRRRLGDSHEERRKTARSTGSDV